jgi:adenine-specific DNA-methyltransferase
VYAVKDTLAALIRERKDSLILDFFAGSGTTYHATALLNAEDDGNRRCILVTNNEVSDETASRLHDEGLFEGDPDFERHGICELITWPRCKYVTQGHRNYGIPLPGMYLNGSQMKEGFKENLEYFKLEFLDPNEVVYGDKFSAILPILWMMAGSKGKLEINEGTNPWFIPQKSPFAVLIKEKYFSGFRKAIVKRPDVKLVFLVTDSEEAFHEMSENLGNVYQTKMLYKSYLDNFRLNTERTL